VLSRKEATRCLWSQTASCFSITLQSFWPAENNYQRVLVTFIINSQSHIQCHILKQDSCWIVLNYDWPSCLIDIHLWQYDTLLRLGTSVVIIRLYVCEFVCFHVRFELPVTATADNCLFTCYPFLSQHRSDHTFVCNQVRFGALHQFLPVCWYTINDFIYQRCGWRLWSANTCEIWSCFRH